MGDWVLMPVPFSLVWIIHLRELPRPANPFLETGSALIFLVQRFHLDRR